MKFILIATQSNNKIPITSFPITLGRESKELSFDDADENSRQALRHISKKHVTFSQKNEDFFINDAGSLNGTFLNNQKLSEEEVKVTPGDTLSLAQKIDFIVNCDSPRQNDEESDLLLLTEGDDHSEVVLDHFPFFLGEQLFDETINQPLGSSENRAECVLTTKDGKQYIAPLNRKHNVRVNGIKIPFGHTLLEHDALISLSPDQEYRLRKKGATGVRHEKTPEPAVSAVDTDLEEDRTIYMEDATMFMNFFDDDEKKTEQKSNPSINGPTKAHQPYPGTAKKILTNRFIRNSIAGVVAFLVVIVGIIFFYRSSDTYKANNLYKAGQYEHCLMTANNALAEKNNKKLNEIGIKSLIKLLTPAFHDALDKNSYDEFSLLIKKYKDALSNISGADTILEVFSFMVKVDTFSDLHKTSHNIDDEEWKTGTTIINQQWRTIQTEYKPIIDEISQIEPLLSEPFESFFSKINDNQENEIYYINKITDLEKNILLLLDGKDFESAEKLLKKFSSAHTKLTNTERWLEDLALYSSLVSQLDNTDLFSIASVSREETPQTALFKKAVNSYIEKEIPPQELLEQIDSAKQYWQNGQPDKAKQVLEELPVTVLQDKIAKKIAFLDKAAHFQKQLADPDSQSGCMVIAELFSFLENETSLLKDQYQEQFTTCRSQAQKLISRHTKNAVDAYDNYRKNGSISGQMRMESSISDHFQKQAKLLATAFSESSFVEKTAASFDIMLLKKTTLIFSEIAKEHTTQVVRIKESVVLSATLKHEKLALFELNEVKGWQD